MDVEISIEKVDALRVKAGAKPFRAHIMGRAFDHHAEADSPSEALLLAAQRWHRIESNKSSQSSITPSS